MHTSSAIAGARSFAVPMWKALAPLCLMVFVVTLLTRHAAGTLAAVAGLLVAIVLVRQPREA